MAWEAAENPVELVHGEPFSDKFKELVALGLSRRVRACQRDDSKTAHSSLCTFASESYAFGLMSRSRFESVLRPRSEIRKSLFNSLSRESRLRGIDLESAFTMAVDYCERLCQWEFGQAELIVAAAATMTPYRAMLAAGLDGLTFETQPHRQGDTRQLGRGGEDVFQFPRSKLFLGGEKDLYLIRQKSMLTTNIGQLSSMTEYQRYILSDTTRPHVVIGSDGTKWSFPHLQAGLVARVDAPGLPKPVVVSQAPGLMLTFIWSIDRGSLEGLTVTIPINPWSEQAMAVIRSRFSDLFAESYWRPWLRAALWQIAYAECRRSLWFVVRPSRKDFWFGKALPYRPGGERVVTFKDVVFASKYESRTMKTVFAEIGDDFRSLAKPDQELTEEHLRAIVRQLESRKGKSNKKRVAVEGIERLIKFGPL